MLREWWRILDSNQPPPECKSGALPDELIPREPAKPKTPSSPLLPKKSLVLHVTVFWCRFTDSNRGPTDYKSVALPAELKRRHSNYITL